MAGLTRLGILVVDQVGDVRLGQLAGVLAGHLLRLLQVVEKPLLLGVEVDVLAEQRVDLLPLVMLAVRVHRPHLWTARDYAGQTNG